MTTVFEDLEALLAAGPVDLGVTEWATLEPAAISAYLEATWSPEADRSPAASAPPLMLVALTNRYLPELLEVRGASSGVNYGADSIVLNAPARAGDRVRARAFLKEETEVPGGVQTKIQVRMEIEGSDEPACIVESISRWMR